MIWFENGKVVTDLDTLSFFEMIFQKWGGYSENEAIAMIENIGSEELTEDFLKDGFLFVSNTCFFPGEEMNLKKVGYKEWVIEDASYEEMEEFVDLIGEDEEEE